MNCECTIADVTEWPVIAGDPWTPVFEFLDSNEEPVDLTGCDVEFVAKMNPDSDDYDVELTSPSGIAMIDAAVGKLTPRVVTTDLIGTVHFRLTITPSGDGNPESIQGTFVVRERL